MRPSVPAGGSPPAAPAPGRTNDWREVSPAGDAPPVAPREEYAGLTIGVLALQGAFVEHVRAIEALGARCREVRLPADLEGLDGLIIPGGESTTIGKLLLAYDLLEPLRRWARQRRPIYGTCAGTILLARNIGGLDQPLIGSLDIQVQRNAFGRQLQSFEADLAVPELGPEPVRSVLIR
jgi:5'-phosphate synthase pdxT subunit